MKAQKIYFFIFSIFYLGIGHTQNLPQLPVYLHVYINTGQKIVFEVDTTDFEFLPKPELLYLACFSIDTASKLIAHKSERKSISLFEVHDIDVKQVNVLLFCAYDTVNGKLLKYKPIRIPALINTHDKRGLNSMALLYSGRDSKVTLVPRSQELQSFYRDSNYLNFNVELASVKKKIDFFVYKKDTLSLNNLFYEMLNYLDFYTEDEYEYAEYFSTVFLKDQKLTRKIIEIRELLYGSLKNTTRDILLNALSLNESSQMIQMYNELKMTYDSFPQLQSSERQFKAGIAKTLAREGKSISDIKKWLPENQNSYQKWKDMIDIIGIVTINSKGRYFEIIDALDILYQEILLEEAELMHNPIYLLPFQYRFNLRLMRQRILETKSVLAINNLNIKDAIGFHYNLLNILPDNKIIQKNTYALLYEFGNKDSALQKLESIIGIEKMHPDIYKEIQLGLDSIKINNSVTNYGSFIGKNIKEFTFMNSENNVVAFAGKAMVIDFWATWCIPCIQSIPTMREIKSDFKNYNVDFFMANIFERVDRKDALNFISAKGIASKDVLFISNVKQFERLGLKSIPWLLFVNSDGEIKDVHVGYNPDNPKQYMAEIKKSINSILEYKN